VLTVKGRMGGESNTIRRLNKGDREGTLKRKKRDEGTKLYLRGIFNGNYAS
jgi:hypothetical protein